MVFPFTVSLNFISLFPIVFPAREECSSDILAAQFNGIGCLETEHYPNVRQIDNRCLASFCGASCSLNECELFPFSAD